MGISSLARVLSLALSLVATLSEGSISLMWKIDWPAVPGASEGPIAAGPGGLVYQPTDGRRMGDGWLLGLNPRTGAVVKQQIGQPQGGVLIQGDTAYVSTEKLHGSGPTWDHELKAISISSNRTDWSVNLSSTMGARPVLVNTPPSVLINTEDGMLHSFSAADGTSLWQTAAVGGIDSSPVLSSDQSTAYVGGDRGIHAVSTSTGKLLWSVGGNKTQGSAAVSAHDESICFASSGGDVSCADRHGKLIWTVSVGTDVETTPTFVKNGTLLLVGTKWAGKMYALNTSDGSTVWRCQLGGILSDASLSSDARTAVFGNQILGGGNGSLFGVDVDSGDMVFNFTLHGRVDDAPWISRLSQETTPESGDVIMFSSIYGDEDDYSRIYALHLLR